MNKLTGRILTATSLMCLAFFLQSCGSDVAPETEFQDCERCPTMVVLPKGEFVMGARDNYKHSHISQRPLQKIHINYQLAVGKYEITREEYYQCFYEKGCSSFPYNIKNSNIPTSRRPMGKLMWGMAKEYVAWLSQKAGREYRLLSESEWEYAARAGSETEYWWGDDVKSEYVICKGCNFPFLYKGGGQYVEKLKPNPFGLYGMHGNVSEWLEDCKVRSLEGIPDDGAPRLEGADCDWHAIRGGSFNHTEKYVTSSSRLFVRASQSVGLQAYGFRVATKDISVRN